ncbi:MAG: transporter related, partial [Bryobacterales bacterium]|nr:transporter related [Bryobacterales bacterium]
MGAALLFTEFLRGAIRWVRTAQADLVQDHISSLIQQKSAAVDLAFYESPDFYNHLHRARDEAGHRPVALLETTGSLLQNAITLLAMVWVLAGFGLWLPAALVAGTIPAFALVLRYAVKQHQFRLRATPAERRAWYYDWLLTTGESAAEVRLFALGDHFQSAFQALRAFLRKERLDLARGQSLAEAGAAACAFAIAATAYVWMIGRAIRGAISIGDLALFHQAFQQGLRLMQVCLENVGQLYQNSLFLGNLFEFLGLEPRVVSPSHPVAMIPTPGKEIRFDGVTFRYPDTRALALQDFHLTIGAGRLVAIVGPNGAGKSTLLKLLCRFYDPEAGRITIDGTDLRNFPLDELRRRITVLFQQPVHYNTSVHENIALGDLTQTPSEAEVRSAAISAGADLFIRGLPEGYRNLLGHWFEKGAELSVGEWQRIALARAFVREAPILVLD